MHIRFSFVSFSGNSLNQLFGSHVLRITILPVPFLGDTITKFQQLTPQNHLGHPAAEAGETTVTGASFLLLHFLVHFKISFFAWWS